MGMNGVERMLLSQIDSTRETVSPRKGNKAPFRAHGRSGYCISVGTMLA